MQMHDTATLAPAVPATTGAEVAGNQRETVVLLTSRVGMGGAERHTISLANLLSRDFNVVFAYLKPEEDMIGQINRQLLLELRCLHVRKRIDLLAARELQSLVQAHGARTIVCANAFALMYAQLARWRSPTPITVVEVFHTTKLRTLKEQLELVFYRPFFWAADHLVFVCDGQRRYWRRRGLWAKNTHMIHNGVDLSHFDPRALEGGISRTRAALGFDPDDRVVGICAVLRPEKAHTDLLAAVARLHREGLQWRVLIIGDGPMRDTIEKEVARLGLDRSVKITGFQSDVRESLMACDVVALVSTAIETFSIAALEAMAMGKAMVMSDVGGAREQVTHGVHGLLFPAGDVTALAACLRQCWDKQKARQMGAAARLRVEREFSQQTMIDRYVGLLGRVFRARGRGRTGIQR